jgi:hypothetical protein
MNPWKYRSPFSPMRRSCIPDIVRRGIDGRKERNAARLESLPGHMEKVM